MAHKSSALLPTLTLCALGAGGLAVYAMASPDDSPPASAPSDQGPKGRHHNPAWEACKKQADDQKLEPGDARHEFMKNCMKSSNSAPPSS